MSDRFWDQMAPYGPAPLFYSYGRGEWVAGSVVQSVQFRMRAGDQALARGVMLMNDGRVYTWTVLREGREHTPGTPRRLATLNRTRGGDSAATFAGIARELLTFERDRIEPELFDGYRVQVDAL